MHAIVAGINIKRAPIEVLERLSVHHSQNAQCVRDLKDVDGIQGAVVLSTCNRLELYASCEHAEQGLAQLRAYLLGKGDGGRPGRGEGLGALVYSYADAAAVRHLFEVVSGLDSLIVGETEIAGQVSRAYRASCKAQAADKLVNVWFQRALSLGKKVRSETRISRCTTSIGRIAVDLAVRELGGIEDKRVLILGAGDMSELTMKYLVRQEVPVVMVSNRSLEKAQRLAERYRFEAYALCDMHVCLERADVVFSATAARGFLIEREDVERAMEKRASRPLLCIDMALPRDIDPEVRKVDGVKCYDINELRDVADRHKNERLRAAGLARRLIDEAVADFDRWQRSLDYIPTIEALRRQAEHIKAEKLAHAMSKLSGLTPSQKDTVQFMAASIVNQLMHNPIASLNAMAGTEKSRAYAAMLEELFGLGSSPGAAPAPAGPFAPGAAPTPGSPCGPPAAAPCPAAACACAPASAGPAPAGPKAAGGAR